jgi:hypothetical protein
LHLRDEARFADAGLACDQDRLPTADARLGDQAVECGEVAFAAE